MENKVLFISSDPITRQQAKKELKGRFELEVEGVEDIDKILSKERDYFSVITVDFITLPKEGLDVFKRIKARFKATFLGITLSSSRTKDVWQNGIQITEIEPDLQIEFARLIIEIELRLKIIDEHELKRIDENELIKLARLIDRRDVYSKNHFEEVKEIAIGIANELKLKKDDIKKLKIMAMIHDIGRVGFCKEVKEIMSKIENTTKWQKVIISKLKIAEIIANLDRIEPDLGHYYEIFEKDEPDTLQEIIAVVDAYDFLVNSSSLKEHLSPEEALDSLEKTKRFSQNILNALWISADKVRLLKEKIAYQKMEDYLKEKYYGKFVAILNGEVVDIGEDSVELAMRVYKKYGYVTTYITQVGKEPEVIWMPSPIGIGGR